MSTPSIARVIKPLFDNTFAFNVLSPASVSPLLILVIATAEMTVKAALLLTPPELAVMLAVVVAATPFVPIGNAALVAPAATGTLAGTVTAALSLARLTDAPPAGAGLLSVTVPVADVPPVTLDGETETPVSTELAGITVSVAVWLTPL